MTRYGALQAASQDAGSWQLIQETDPGQWAPLARGGKLNIIALADTLNAGSRPVQTDSEWAEKAGFTKPANPAPAISYGEVMGWDQDTYLQHRARLWTDGGRDYRDGSAGGRPYTSNAAQVMTGRKENHPALKIQATQLQRLTGAAENVWNTFCTGDTFADDKRREWLADNWPQLAQALSTLQRTLHDDDGPRP